MRVQLVHEPGYMVNYGLGSVLTADIRQHTREAIGPFDTGNPQWFSWTSEELLRFGEEIDTAALLKQFLGRPVSPQPLLQQIRRIAPKK
jgi:Zn-dependent M32 family carboxypeptidase